MGQQQAETTAPERPTGAQKNKKQRENTKKDVQGTTPAKHKPREWAAQQQAATTANVPPTAAQKQKSGWRTRENKRQGDDTRETQTRGGGGE